MDQLAKDGCANLENIRNALMAPLITIEQDHQDERRMMPIDMGVDLALQDADKSVFYTYAGQFWEMRHGLGGYKDRRTVQATRPLLKALGDAIATQKPQRVSISDGTYVMPDGEVLTELEMIKRSGTDGRGKPD
jgi:hypothetical protein